MSTALPASPADAIDRHRRSIDRALERNLKIRLPNWPLADIPNELRPGAVQVFLLRVHAVDRARAPAQERHADIAITVTRAPRHDEPRVRPEAEARRNPTSGRLRADGKRRVVVRPIDRRRPGERL
jgi:hypothetical protein